VLIHRVKAGQAYEYELLYDGEGDGGTPFVLGLSGLKHSYDGVRSGQSAERSGSGRPPVGARSAGGRASGMAAEGEKTATPGTSAAEAPEMRLLGESATALSYMQPPAHRANGSSPVPVSAARLPGA
jgi:hypothetical protein